MFLDNFVFITYPRVVKMFQYFYCIIDGHSLNIHRTLDILKSQNPEHWIQYFSHGVCLDDEEKVCIPLIIADSITKC